MNRHAAITPVQRLLEFPFLPLIPHRLYSHHWVISVQIPILANPQSASLRGKHSFVNITRNNFHT